MSVLLTIGEFSRTTHLSVKALRHYDDVGLLSPAKVDSSSGYRRGQYLVTEDDTDDPAAYRTEVCWPIRADAIPATRT